MAGWKRGVFSYFSRDDDIEVLADEISDTAEETSPVRAVSRASRFVHRDFCTLSEEEQEI